MLWLQRQSIIRKRVEAILRKIKTVSRSRDKDVRCRILKLYSCLLILRRQSSIFDFSRIFSRFVIVSWISESDMTDINNNKCPTFQWPQHSFLVEHLRIEHSKASTLSEELQNHLKDLGIYHEDETTRGVKTKIVLAAKLSLIPRKHIWITFDAFMARNRPGLITDPDTPIVKKKKRRSRGKKKPKNKVEPIETIGTEIVEKETDKLSFLEPRTCETLVRAI